MTLRRALAGTAALFLCGVALFAWRTQPPLPDPAELAERCASSRPDWNSYLEDLKRDLGTAATAAWRGRPVAAAWDAAGASVTFEIYGPWAEYDFGAPVLMRDPYGGARRDTEFARTGSRAVYRFPPPEMAPGGAAAWLEVQYPDGLRRLMLDADGAWRGE